VSCGVTQCQEILRGAMAMGAARGNLVETQEELQQHARRTNAKLTYSKHWRRHDIPREHARV
jgi:electron transfer flavoprotein alpha/beta subunit